MLSLVLQILKFHVILLNLGKTILKCPSRGEISNFLGLNVHQSSGGICINQSKYAFEILKKHGMEVCDSIGTPMREHTKLDVDILGKHVDATKYRSIMMYLTSSRPDILLLSPTMLDIRLIRLNQTSRRLNGSFNTLKAPSTTLVSCRIYSLIDLEPMDR